MASNKELTMQLHTYQQVIGYFYSGLNKLCADELADVDMALQELLEMQAEDYVDDDNISECQRNLRFKIRHTLGIFAVRAANQAMGQLEEKSKHRDGLDPEYVEEDM